MQEGYVFFEGYKTYYRIFGEQHAGKLPLLVLHGGPGSTHNYLLTLRKLADDGRQVIFYDQFGCGKSAGNRRTNLWEVKTFVQQVGAVRQALGLDDVHILGHSWGGMLAIEYMLAKPKGVHGLVLSSAMISLPLYQQEVDKLVAELPAPFAEDLVRCHQAGDFTSQKYQDAYAAYSDRHLCRVKDWPKEAEVPKGERNAVQYVKMWGSDEAYIKDGDLKDWDVIDRLPEITHPTLVISGRYDELTPHQSDITHQQIKDSKQVIIEDASHCHHVEQETASLGAVSDFLKLLGEQ